MDGKHIASSVWNGIVGWVRQESAAATALVQAFIALGIAFSWWHWSDAQTGAVIGIVAAMLGMFVRSQVTPIVRPRSSRNIPLTEAAPPPAGYQAEHAAMPPAGSPTRPDIMPPGGPNAAPPTGPPPGPPTGPPPGPPPGPPGQPPFPPPGR